MNILLLTFYFPPDLCAGSFRADALVKQVVTDVKEKSFVTIITTMPNRYSDHKVEALCYEANDAYEIYRISIPAHTSGLLDQAVAFAFYSIRAMMILRKNHDFDIVVGTSSRLMTAFLASLYSRYSKTTLYLDMRDLFSDVMREKLSSLTKRLVLPVIERIENFTFSKAKVINIVSPGFVGFFETRFPLVRLTQHSNGIDSEFLTSLSFAKSEPDNVRSIFYAGNIGDGQGLHKIIPPLAKSLEGIAKFLIVGSGGAKQALIDSLANENLTNVEVRPPVPRSELMEMYKQADILFLHLNDYEAFEKVLPSKVFEYGATGKPILAGVAGYAEDFLRGEVPGAYLFCPCDSGQAQDAFSAVKFGDIDRDEFKQKYSRTVIMSKMAADILSLE